VKTFLFLYDQSGNTGFFWKRDSHPDPGCCYGELNPSRGRETPKDESVAEPLNDRT